MDPDQPIKDFLEGQPRAHFWRELRETLAERLRDALAERDALPEDDPTRPTREKRVRELRAQVAALAQEEAVTQFVEDSVRASLSRPGAALSDDEDE